jgi:Formyl transferase
VPRFYLFVSRENVFHPPVLHEILRRHRAEVVGAAIFPGPRHASLRAVIRQALALDGWRAVPRMARRWLAHRWACLRHSPPHFSSVERLFEAHRLKPDLFRNPNDAECVARVRALRTEVVLNFQPWYLHREVLGAPSAGCLNLHTAALPQYRGVEPVVRALLAGDKTIGVSIHTMEEEIDAGRVLAQAQVPRAASVFECYRATFAKVPDLVDVAIDALAASNKAARNDRGGEGTYYGPLTAAEIAAFRQLGASYL